MALVLNQAEKSSLISALVTNCAGWDEGDVEVLNRMTNEKIVAHAEGCATINQLVFNEDTEDSGLPDTLEPSSASELERVAEDELEEEEIGPAPQGERGPPSGTEETEDLDQPTKCHDDEGNEIDCPDSDQADGENVTENEYLSYLPTRIRSVVINALRFEHAQKELIVSAITTNRRNQFSPSFLMNKPLRELQALAELAVPKRAQALYVGAQGGPTLNEDLDRDDILTIPTLEFSNAN